MDKKEYMREYMKDYYKKNSKQHERHKEMMRNSMKERTDRQRHEIFKLLGGKCVHCGFSDIRALQIDHVNGGGTQHRKGKSLNDFYEIILNGIKSSSKDYQLLCANCNWIKRDENSECGQKTATFK